MVEKETNMKKILFVNDEMCMGGVARVLNTLMESLDKSKYEIDLLVLHPHGELMDEIPEGVTILKSHSFFSVVDMSIGMAIKNRNIKVLLHKLYLVFLLKTGLIHNKIKKIRSKILETEYDVEFAAKEGFCTIFTAAGKAKRKINWVLVDYEEFNYSKRHMKLLRKSLEKIELNIANSQKAARAFQQVFGVDNVKSIHTLMDEKKVKEGIKMPLSQKIQSKDIPNVVTVGRFHHQKGMERLIKASIAVHNLGIYHQLLLIGSGELESQLKELAREYKHIEFLGIQKNPYNWIHVSDLFVLPSYYEGFATIVTESLIAGTPVLATEVAGIQEQLMQEEYGRIVENTQEAITKGLQELLMDRDYLRTCKMKLNTYQYPNAKILKEYEKEFDYDEEVK